MALVCDRSLFVSLSEPCVSSLTMVIACPICRVAVRLGEKFLASTQCEVGTESMLAADPEGVIWNR